MPAFRQDSKCSQNVRLSCLRKLFDFFPARPKPSPQMQSARAPQTDITFFACLPRSAAPFLRVALIDEHARVWSGTCPGAINVWKTSVWDSLRIRLQASQCAQLHRDQYRVRVHHPISLTLANTFTRSEQQQQPSRTTRALTREDEADTADGAGNNTANDAPNQQIVSPH